MTWLCDSPSFGGLRHLLFEEPTEEESDLELPDPTPPLLLA